MPILYTLRDVSLSLEYRLWHILLQLGQTQAVEGVALTKILGNTYGITNGLPWVFMGDDGRPTRDNVTIYVAGVEVDNTTLTIDWKRARVTFPAPPVGAVTADILFYRVNIREGYPTKTELKMTNLPIIAHTVDSMKNRAFAIGTRAQFARWSGSIDVLATSDPHVKDLTDMISLYITRLPLLNMSEHQYFSSSGTGDIDPEFDFETQFINSMHVPPNGHPTCRQLPPREGGSDKERFRGLVSFDFEEVR